MLHLEAKNPLIEAAFAAALADDYEETTLDRILTDFDFTTYRVSTPEDKNRVLLSIEIKCWDDLARYGAVALLEERYAQYSFVQCLSGANCEPGYNFSLYIDTTAARAQLDAEQRVAFVEEVALLKRTCFAAPFLKAFARYAELAKETPADPNNIYGEDSVARVNSSEAVLRLDYRGAESIFIKPANDRVTVIFSTVFNDETDRLFSKVFLQEFSDARRRSIQKAPQVINSHGAPPLEIRDAVNDTGDKTYITFVLFPRHVTSLEARWNSITQLELFRSYFHYHIKIVKCYLHQRMRHRVTNFTKVLNRARKDVDEADLRAERKTASGRRFEVK